MQQITDKTFKTEVENYPGFILIEFYASWCGKCHKGMELLNKFSKDAGIKAGIVDLQKNPRLLIRFTSNGLPLFVLFTNGNPIKQVTGLCDLREEFYDLCNEDQQRY